MERIARRLTVPEDFAGRRLDQAAAQLLPEFSRSRLKTWIDAGRLTVAGQRARAADAAQGRGGARARNGARDGRRGCARADPARRRARGRRAARDRQAGRPRRASGRGQSLGHAAERAAARVPGARGAAARGPRAPARQGHERPVARRAHAREPEDARGRARAAHDPPHLSSGVPRRAHGRRHRRCADRPAPARAHQDGRPRRGPRRRLRAIGCIERFRAHTLCEVELETGRTHQIRVHMAHIRAPLVGDPVYGGRPRPPRGPSERAACRAAGLQTASAARDAAVLGAPARPASSSRSRARSRPICAS